MAQALADALILVFAKAPVAGRVKTRLGAGLGQRTAWVVYRRLLRQTLTRLAAAGAGALECWCTPSTRHPGLQAYRRRWRLRSQRGADLGQRMWHAARAGLRHHAYVLLVGTDCPGLDAAYLARAAQRLAAGAHVVLGPACDGGYVLLGLRTPAAALFQGLPWGGPRVLPQTRRRLRRLGLTVAELAPLADIDRPRDFGRWRCRRTVGLDLA